MSKERIFQSYLAEQEKSRDILGAHGRLGVATVRLGAKVNQGSIPDIRARMCLRRARQTSRVKAEESSIRWLARRMSRGSTGRVASPMVGFSTTVPK